MRRDTIPKSKAFDLGRWAPLLFGLSVIWEVFLIADFTLPQIFHAAAKVAVAGQVIAVAWYYGGLRSRLRRGTAGQALTLGPVARREDLAAEPAVRSIGQVEPPAAGAGE